MQGLWFRGSRVEGFRGGLGDLECRSLRSRVEGLGVTKFRQDVEGSGRL